MKRPKYQESWPESWKSSYKYDSLELFTTFDKSSLGYTYAYLKRFEEVMRYIKKYIPKNSSILDIASAQGNFTLSLAEKEYRVTWNDLREELIGYVKLKYERGNIDYCPGNCFDLPFKRSFDCVLITEVIEHVAHPNQFLCKMASFLKPQGYIVMTTPNGQYLKNNLPKFSQCPNPEIYETQQFKPDSDGHIFLFYAHEICDLAKKAGLKVIEIKTFTNFLTNGHIKSHLALPYIPRSFVQIIEAITSNNESLFRYFNTGMLAVLKKL